MFWLSIIQVLSKRVGVRLRDGYSPECDELSKFILMMDRFFDCLNGRSLKEHIHTRKPDLAPYTNINDPRFAVSASQLYITPIAYQCGKLN